MTDKLSSAAVIQFQHPLPRPSDQTRFASFLSILVLQEPGSFLDHRRSCPDINIRAFGILPFRGPKWQSHFEKVLMRSGKGNLLLSLGLGELGSLGVDDGVAALLGEEGLEAIKVVHGNTLGTSLGALSPGGLSPLGGNVGFLEGLKNCLGASTTLDGDLQVGDSQTLEVNNTTEDTRAGTIDEGLRERQSQQRH